jgi:hypothetical protein
LEVSAGGLIKISNSGSIFLYYKKYEGRACSTNGGEEECIKDIGAKARRKGTTGKTKT